MGPFNFPWLTFWAFVVTAFSIVTPVTGLSSASYDPTDGSKIFWLAPNGSAFMRSFFFYDYAYYVTIGDVNKYRDVSEEYLIASTQGILAVQAHDFVDDVGTYYYRMNQPTSTEKTPDAIMAVIFNAGSQPQSDFTVGYCLKNSPLSGTSALSTPI